MIISLIFVALSGLMGVGMYFLVIGIVFLLAEAVYFGQQPTILNCRFILFYC